VSARDDVIAACDQFACARSSKKMDERHEAFTAALDTLIAETRQQALEDAVRVCDTWRDLSEETRALKAVNEADEHGTRSDYFNRLRHHNSVSLYNSGLANAARTIRALKTAPTTKETSNG